MYNFQLEIFDDHPLIQWEDNRILVDTGSPATIHSSTALGFCNEVYQVKSNYGGVTVHAISELLGTPITTLLGADILSKYKIHLDYEKRLAVFSRTPIPFEGKEVAISSFKGIPIIEIVIGSDKIKCFLDTGARLSYLPSNITRLHPIVGQEQDFYPGLGNFQTDCYEIMSQFDGQDFMVKCGNLPRSLEMVLMLGGTKGIVGYDFFSAFKVLLDLGTAAIRYTR